MHKPDIKELPSEHYTMVRDEPEKFLEYYDSCIKAGNGDFVNSKGEVTHNIPSFASWYIMDPWGCMDICPSHYPREAALAGAAMFLYLWVQRIDTGIAAELARNHAYAMNLWIERQNSGTI